jgi:predicted DNA-binding transcriptional regulator AlpA
VPVGAAVGGDYLGCAMDAVTTDAPIMNARQVCKWLGMSPQTLRLMLMTDACPRPLPMPGKKPRWARRSWDKWLEAGGKR